MIAITDYAALRDARRTLTATADSVMIERGFFVQPGPPLLVCDARSVLPCGCFAAVGLRMDTREASVGGSPCSGQHKRLMERFSLALTDSLVNPTTRPLIDVVDELLTGVRP